MGMALVLNERFAGRPLMRSLLLIPWSLSRIVVGLLWVGLLDFEFGALNGLLHQAGLIDSYIAFFKSGWSSLNVLVSVYMWNQAPFAPLLFLAGMQSIGQDWCAARRRRRAPYWSGTGRRSLVLYGRVALVSLWRIGPFVWLFVTSVSSQKHLMARPLSFVPPEVPLDNYRMIMGLMRFHAEGQASKILPSMWNTLVVASAVTAVNLVLVIHDDNVHGLTAVSVKR